MSRCSILSSVSFRQLGRSGLGAVFGVVAVSVQGFIYQTDLEFYSPGDFNGDRQMDFVVTDRATGRYRVAYQTGAGEFKWGRVRGSQVSKVTGFAVGHLLDENRDAVAITSPDAAQIMVFDVADPEAEPASTAYIGATLGPNALVAVDIGGEGNTKHEGHVCDGAGAGGRICLGHPGNRAGSPAERTAAGQSEDRAFLDGPMRSDLG